MHILFQIATTYLIQINENDKALVDNTNISESLSKNRSTVKIYFVVAPTRSTGNVNYDITLNKQVIKNAQK